MSFKFNEQITIPASDCMFKLTRVNRIKHLIDKKKLICLINALVFSKLFYCSTIWSSMSEKNVKKLQLVQNYACRIVAGLRKYDHVSEALKSLKWLNLYSDRGGGFSNPPSGKNVITPTPKEL